MKNNGVTLIELLIVLAIISILVAALTIAVVGLIENAKYDKATALIQRLTLGCHNYKSEFKVFPPAGGTPSFPQSSRYLHYYLGRAFTYYLQAGIISKPHKPYVIFTMLDMQNHVDPNSGTGLVIVDAWERALSYYRVDPYDDTSWDSLNDIELTTSGYAWDNTVPKGKGAYIWTNRGTTGAAELEDDVNNWQQ